VEERLGELEHVHAGCIHQLVLDGDQVRAGDQLDFGPERGVEQLLFDAHRHEVEQFAHRILVQGHD